MACCVIRISASSCVEQRSRRSILTPLAISTGTSLIPAILRVWFGVALVYSLCREGLLQAWHLVGPCSLYWWERLALPAQASLGSGCVREEIASGMRIDRRDLRVTDIFRNPRRRPPPSWIFKSSTFGTFRHVNSVVLELYIKFGSTICEISALRSTHLCSRRSFDDVSRINFRFLLLVRWLSPHGRGASYHKIWCRYMYPAQSYWHFS